MKILMQMWCFTAGKSQSVVSAIYEDTIISSLIKDCRKWQLSILKSSDLLSGLFPWCPLLLYCLSTPSAIYWSHFVVFLVTKLITFQALISQLHLQLPACEIALCCFNVRHSKRSLKRSVNSPIKWKMFFCVVTLRLWVKGCTINDCILIASWEKHRSCFLVLFYKIPP